MNIGSVQVFLQPVAYMVEMKEQLEIFARCIEDNNLGAEELAYQLGFELPLRSG